MKKTQIDSLYAISFSLLYIFMEQFFFPAGFALVQLMFDCTILMFHII